MGDSYGVIVVSRSGDDNLRNEQLGRVRAYMQHFMPFNDHGQPSGWIVTNEILPYIGEVHLISTPDERIAKLVGNEIRGLIERAELSDLVVLNRMGEDSRRMDHEANRYQRLAEIAERVIRETKPLKMFASKD